MKLCKNCSKFSFNQCNSENLGIEPVMGHTKSDCPLSVREDPNRCGMDAKWFVERIPKVTEPYHIVEASDPSYPMAKSIWNFITKG